MAWFLVKNRNDRLDSIAVYYDAEVALRACEAQERILGFDNSEYRICLFSADSLGTLAATHANWLDVDPMAAHRRLEAALFPTETSES